MDDIQTIVIGAGCATIALGSALAFFIMKKKRSAVAPMEPVVEEETVEELDTTVSQGYFFTYMNRHWTWLCVSLKR